VPDRGREVNREDEDDAADNRVVPDEPT
jgi:hypothetical protein